ncbi:hypothetical protein BU16DRAFT_289505 [Lophium mytilinum]|uniref:Uncharacterized protein n=1 Tax=Lophium mytilinum TaxID=390894 RepID=A0A6A6R226_9PEZI|nr:hypothetical protein BU16DRAFT_289505 [Lophium mytilinum]
MNVTVLATSTSGHRFAAFHYAGKGCVSVILPALMSLLATDFGSTLTGRDSSFDSSAIAN